MEEEDQEFEYTSKIDVGSFAHLNDTKFQKPSPVKHLHKGLLGFSANDAGSILTQSDGGGEPEVSKGQPEGAESS